MISCPVSEFKNFSPIAVWPLNMGSIGCLETSFTTNLRRITPQKNAGLIYTAAEAWNHP
jgi:hypothetical protein